MQSSPAILSAAAIAAAYRGIATSGGFLIRCPCSGHGKGRGDLHPSLYIRDGERRLLVNCYAGCEPATILEALGQAPPAAAPNLTAPADLAAKPSFSRETARAIWRGSRPIDGTHAAAYLAARGLPGPYPSALRFLPSTARDPHPTLCAALTDPQSRVVAVELTYLDSARPQKADIAEPRRVIGPARGASIHCARASEILGLAEGLESALSAQRLFGVPTWAATSAPRLPLVVVPQCVRRIIYFGDPDGAGAAALEKLRATHPNIEIEDRTSPEPNRDWNDLLRDGVTGATSKSEIILTDFTANH